MIWSKLKKQIESLLAEALRGRVKYHLTRYGLGVSESMTRGWITFDGREVINCSTIKQERDSYYLTGKWYSGEEIVRDELHRRGIFTREEFLDALAECVDKPPQSTLQSSNPLTRAIALLDRRVGKRKLRQMAFGKDELQIVKEFYRIRCQAEGLPEEPGDQ